MKAYLALISAAVIGLAACSQEPAASGSAASGEVPAASEAAPEAASEVASAVPEAASAASETAPAAAAADDKCSVTVGSNDVMQFDTKEIQVSKSCKEFTVHLKHSGTQPKVGMGHNIVITTAENMDGVLKDGAGAGADGDYVKAGDERIIAHTKLIGGGEETSVTFDPAKLTGGSYKFFCSFPGHGALMNGNVVLVD